MIARYYFHLSTLGKKKVTTNQYSEYQEGDMLIAVVNTKGKMLRFYDASKYTYVGDYR